MTQGANLLGDHSKPFASATRTRSFDSRVERKQVRLESNRVNYSNNCLDFLCTFIDVFHRAFSGNDDVAGFSSQSEGFVGNGIRLFSTINVRAGIFRDFTQSNIRTFKRKLLIFSSGRQYLRNIVQIRLRPPDNRTGIPNFAHDLFDVSPSFDDFTGCPSKLADFIVAA